ncbi:type IV secretion system DNA-binding domain-containing protein [Candidatus Saccharibacteria bacterium]|nr:type IV secretion system DNA-binding domain-containing protein [Candidatus Saccharibacteria bacterium]
MGEFFGWISWPLLLVAVAVVFVVLAQKNFKKATAIQQGSVDNVLLLLEIPKDNDKKELAAEQLFAALHGILRDEKELASNAQEHLSFEIVSHNGMIQFFVWCPRPLRSFVEGQIYSQYPTVQIKAVDEDYLSHQRDHSIVATTDLVLTENQALPIKTFDTFDVDPLAGITGTLAKLENTGEELWIQILVRPINDDWHKKSKEWIDSVKNPPKLGFFNLLLDFKWIAGVFSALWTPPESGSITEPAIKATELSDRDKARISAAEEKMGRLGYALKIRLAYLGEEKENARLNLQALTGSFKQFNTPILNGFKSTGIDFSGNLTGYRMRAFDDDGFVLNIKELASLYHLPNTSVETPNIVWATTRVAEPPAKLPLVTGNPEIDCDISAFGLTNFRGVNHQFGMWRRDRNRHIYIIGQTGAGKSGLLELFALSDIFYDQGYAIIDPHGDFAINNLKFIPEHRMKDVIYFNPADKDFPIAFNPLEVTDEERKPNISSEVIGVLKRMFGESWGPRLEHILRYTLLALLDRPETTLLDVSRMLTSASFRKETLEYCKDVTVLQFWKQEFGQWSEKQVNESVAPILNKVGAFTANPIIRNIIGQPKSSFDMRKIMDEGKILVVNLSKGMIGEDNAGILGAFLVTKVQLAAMSRADIDRVEDRRPFFLYVDEFQNFATDSFAVILSEARKYGLNLTVANQYIAQMSDSVRDAVFGNVGSMISFRVSAEDAEFLARQFEPEFTSSDLLAMNNRNFVINMIIKGEKARAFSATTLNIPPTPENGVFDKIIDHSRGQYARTRKEVEQEIAGIMGGAETYMEELREENRTKTERAEAEQKTWIKSTKTKMAFKPADVSKPERADKPEKKPFVRTPESEFRKMKLSPNAVKGEKTSGLKDIGEMIKIDHKKK